jgi:hypothetical protein
MKLDDIWTCLSSLNLDWAGIVQHGLFGDFKANLIREWCIIFQRFTCFVGQFRWCKKAAFRET